jgi:D-apionolactonase
MSDRHLVRAGDVELELDGVDLRYLRVGDTELVRRVYAAVRDHNWTTLPGELVEPVSLTEDAGGTHATFALRHVGEEIDLTWYGTLDARPDGTVELGFVGRAARAFRYNRIGFCVLHPIAGFAGQRYRGASPAGAVAGVLPELVEPQPFVGGVYVPFVSPVSALSLDVEGGGTVEIRFRGDLWESEDQRNWSDASFKTYCTPLSLGVPHRLEANQEIRQSIVISVAGVPVRRRPRSGHDVVVGEPTGRVLPPLGTCLPDERDEPDARQLATLRELGLSHVRVDLPADGLDVLERAAALAGSLDASLEVALHLREPDDLAALGAVLGELEIARAIVLDADARSAAPNETASRRLVELARAALADGTPALAGTDMNFCELNRTRPDSASADGVAYPVAAQVHAFDDRSVLETPGAQGDQVRLAREISGGAPVAVSPITLRPRFNAVAVEDAADNGDGLPSSVDARQREPLCAAFALASIASCAAAGAGSLTLFRLTGWEGLAERPGGSRRPELFPSRAREEFPVAAVFRALAGLHGAPLRACVVGEPLATAAIALRRDDGSTRVVVANLAEQERELRASIDGIDRAVRVGPRAIAILDQ